jgi:putative serine protease PepD
VIQALGDHAIADVAGLSQVLAAMKPGQKVAVKITRPDGSAATLMVTLGELPPA